MSVFSLKIDIADNKFFNGETSPLFSQSQAKLARQFHQKIAGYRPTPLCALDDLANLFGVKKILVKDESKRFGLNAFKMLAVRTPSLNYCVKNIILISKRCHLST